MIDEIKRIEEAGLAIRKFEAWQDVRHYMLFDNELITIPVGFKLYADSEGIWLKTY